MPILDVPGAKLEYTTRGKGPQLLLISGAPGNATVFRHVVPFLESRFTVTTYSRRGLSGSILDGPQDYSQRLNTDADDASALVELLAKDSGEKVFVFGTSSGAVVAQTLLSRNTSGVQLCVLHEPPSVMVLPDGEERSGGFQQLYNLYRGQGIDAALSMFFSLASSGEEKDAMQQMMNPKIDADQRADITYWFERELIPYPCAMPDMESLERHKGLIVCSVGESTRGSFSGEPIEKMAEVIGSEVKALAGGHIGYCTHAEEFAEQLKEILI